MRRAEQAQVTEFGASPECERLDVIDLKVPLCTASCSAWRTEGALTIVSLDYRLLDSSGDVALSAAYGGFFGASGF